VSSVRRAAVLPFAVAFGGILLASAPAWATVKANWTTPTDNSTFTTANPIDFAVSLDRGAVLPDSATVTMSLAVPGPQPGPFKVATSTGSQSASSLKFTFTPACPNQSGSCAAGSAPAYNGRYTASVSGASVPTRTVVLQIPPAAPTGVTASAAGTHRVHVAWDANDEPDLTGYDVFTDDGGIVASNLPKDQTYVEFDLPSTGYGGTHGYVVRAHRLACSNCGDSPGSDAQLDSPMSQPASVTFTEPGTDPSPSPGTGGSTDTSGGYDNGSGTNGNGTGTTTGNGGGGSKNGGGATDQNGDTYNSGNDGGAFSSGTKTSAQDQRTAFGLTFKSFAPKLGAPKLPPQPSFAGPTIGQLPEGTYNPTLPYGKRTVTTNEKIASNSLTSQFVDSLTTAFEGRKLYRSIAIALLLLLAAGHLRLWLRHPDAT
jgi:uncharacterized membrane protein YgcG